MFLEEVSKRAQKLNISQHLFGTFDYTRTFNLKDDKSSFDNSQPEIELIPSTPTNARQKIKQICRQVKNQISLNNRIKLKAGLGSGDKFPNLGKLKNVLNQQMPEIGSKEGQILVFVLWSFENDKDLIKKIKQQFQSKPQEKQVRIISITLNQEINALKQNISDLGGVQSPKIKIDHFNITGKESECKIIYVLGEAIVPYACYADEKGIVKFIGHPKKLLEVLPELEKKVVEEKKKKENLQGQDVIDGSQFNEIQKKFSNPQEFKKAFSKITSIYLKMNIKSCCVEGITKCRVKIQQLCLKKGDQEEIMKQLRSIKNINLTDLKKVYIKQSQMPKLKKNCCDCNKQLAYPLYWCEKDNEKFLCIDCGQKKSEQRKTGLILLMKELPNIYSGYLNEKLSKDQSCSVCRKDERQVAYLCLLQKIDENEKNLKVLCGVCAEKMKKKEEQIINWLKNEKIEFNYAWLRIQKEENIMVEPQQRRQ